MAFDAPEAFPLFGKMSKITALHCLILTHYSQQIAVFINLRPPVKNMPSISKMQNLAIFRIL
jgi:hypothetical protein